MSPALALSLWLTLLLCLLRFDPARNRATSLPALWVPVMWLFFLESRLPSQWIGSPAGGVVGVYEEGNPLDRSVLSILILLAIVVLISRSFRWGSFFRDNAPLIVFLGFALVSISWSDFPLIAFKRWFKDLGNYLMVLVVLSDPFPFEALRVLLRRLCYLLIPLSVLLIKYYPAIGKTYSAWTGAQEFAGAMTDKNMLGAVCLISGLFFFWDTLARWRERRETQTRKIIVVNAAFIAMTAWLLKISNSDTSIVCFAVGCSVVAVAHMNYMHYRPTFLKLLVPTCFLLYVILAFGFNINAQLAPALGRSPNLTGRTEIWKYLLSQHTSPMLGTGFQSFWLGPRLQGVWQHFAHINEAHNGYLDIYLNLGLIGLLLFIVFLLASYRTICKRLSPFTSLASFSLAMWAVLVFYNISEAGFEAGLPWLTFLLVAITVSRQGNERASDAITLEGAGARRRLPTFSAEALGVRRFGRQTRT